MEHKITRLVHVGLNCLKVTFEDGSSVCCPPLRDVQPWENIRCVGAKCYVGGELVLDANTYYNNGEAC